MAYSMTGVGYGEVKKAGNTYTVELKSVNNRYLEVSCRMPQGLSQFEYEVRDMIRKQIHRGKLYVNITVKSDQTNGAGFQVDKAAAKSVAGILKDLKKTAGIEDPVRMEHLLKFSEIFQSSNDIQDTEKNWAMVKTALETALQNLKKMRAKEAKALVKDITGRIQILEKKVKSVEKLAKQCQQDKYEKISGRIKSMIQDVDFDADRLNTEIALMANKMDVTEECVRLHSHNKLFIESIKDEDTVGKKLNFLLQEMNREANTISSKACHAEISHLVVIIKEEIEKLREQVQNLE